MDGCLKVFIPAARVESFYAKAKTALAGAGVRLGLDKALPILDISSLACFEFAVIGSSLRSRAPYVFPLLATSRHASYPVSSGRPLETVPGADWVVLGGDPARFAQALALAAPGREAVRFVPFLGVSGALARKRQESDISVRLRKEWFFVNHVAVAQVMDRLLELPEERWHETGYVAVRDHYGVFAPYVEALAARPPRLVVELGCGLGQTARSLAARFPEARVVGLDVSRESLDVAREKFRLPNLEYREFDFSRRFAFEDGSVDLVVSSSALNISSNQARTAAETFRILSRDGLLVNGCIFEPFHTYWDYPQSAFLPSRSNLLLDDWLQAARARGMGMELYTWPGAVSPHYFASGRLESFPGLYEGWRAGLPDRPFTPWDYAHCTGVMVAGGRSGGQGRPCRVPPANHLDAVEDILLAFERQTQAGKDLSCVNWLVAASCHDLFPESVPFLQACAPKASAVIGEALDSALLGHMQQMAS